MMNAMQLRKLAQKYLDEAEGNKCKAIKAIESEKALDTRTKVYMTAYLKTTDRSFCK